MLSFNSQSFQLFNVFRSLSLFLCFLLLLLLLLLCISKFPFYIQRHYRKAFNSSHNVLCIWILTEEMETFFCWLLLFFHSQAKKNFGLALLSLKSVLGKKLCLHYDQISKYPIHLGLDYLQYHGNLLKNQVEQDFFLNIFIAIYDYLPIFF